jgi:hypothetical protein
MDENSQKKLFLGLSLGSILNIPSIFGLLYLQHIVSCMLRAGIGYYVYFRQCKSELTWRKHLKWVQMIKNAMFRIKLGLILNIP